MVLAMAALPYIFRRSACVRTIYRSHVQHERGTKHGKNNSCIATRGKHQPHQDASMALSPAILDQTDHGDFSIVELRLASSTSLEEAAMANIAGPDFCTSGFKANVECQDYHS